MSWQAVQKNGLLFYRFQDPDWDKVHHGFFTRKGGVSKPPFDFLNLSSSVGDDQEKVTENLRRALAVIGVTKEEVVMASLIHGNKVALVGVDHQGKILEDTDGLITAEPGLVLFMKFADCLPVLLTDLSLPAVAIIHVGWRGLAVGVLEAALEVFEGNLGSQISFLRVALGPGIRGCCYKVGEEVIEALKPRLGENLPLQRLNNSWYLDLPEAVRLHLSNLGVSSVISAEVCTACNLEDWYSYRAENRKTGRFGVWIQNL